MKIASVLEKEKDYTRPDLYKMERNLIKSHLRHNFRVLSNNTFEHHSY
jgi:hypothetical protein